MSHQSNGNEGGAGGGPPSRNQQLYSYTNMSNQVLVSRRDRHAGADADKDSLTQDVKSLRDTTDVRSMMQQMGSRARESEGSKSTSKELQAIKKKRAEAEADSQKLNRRGTDNTAGSRPAKRARTAATANNSSLLSSTADLYAEAVYQPTTRDTRLAYDTLLSFITDEIGDTHGSVSEDVLISLADDLLQVLKGKHSANSTLEQQRQQIEQLLKRGKTIDAERFRQLINISKQINDYRVADDDDDEQRNGNADDTSQLGKDVDVSVVFDDDAEENMRGDIDDSDLVGDGESYDGTVAVDDDDVLSDDDSNADAADDALYDDEDATSDILDDDNLDNDTATKPRKASDQLDARSIDAHWIQRQLAPTADDAIHAQKLANDVYSILQDQNLSDSKLESQLVTSLGFERFHIIKQLLHHRWKIVWAIKLARASDDTERKQVELELLQNPEWRVIYNELHNTAASTNGNGAASAKNSKRMQIKTEARHQQMDIDTDALKPALSDTHWKPSKQLLDLTALQFPQGAHTVTTGEVKLPPKSEVIQKKGYQEVHVPPYQPQPMSADEKIVAINELPSWAQPAFSGMTALNRIQSRVYKTALNSAENMLVCAPTGAGKTNVAMLTMLREIGLHILPDNTVDKSAFKIVYVAPMKALVQEVVANFSRRLSHYGLSVKELSGDVQLSRQQLDDTQVIVTTPEKFDVVTRKSGNDRSFLSKVTLMIIDEIHLLHDSRGPVLEAIVARTIRQIEQTAELVRIVGISATLPNYHDVALFLRVNRERGLFAFDSSYRPVPLQQQYIGLSQKKPHKRLEAMNELVYEKCVAHAKDKNQVLVFVHSRKDTGNTAKILRDMAQENDTLRLFVQEGSGREVLLKEEAQNAKSPILRDLLPYGIAIHHAGLARSDRTMVEELFADNHLAVLVSTATLAWGVNLPAHAVLIKGTQVYSPELGGFTELSPQDTIQMLGRAGRPQFDTRGEGIILTTQKEMYYYLSLLNAQLPVESQLISKLADLLNAEIVLGTVTNVNEAVLWLAYTYLYIRMLRAPHLYGIDPDTVEHDPYLQQRRVDLIHAAAVQLDRHKLVTYDRRTGILAATELGTIASHYYITAASMSVYTEHMTAYTSDIDLFRIFSLSSEFAQMSVRADEKLEVAKLLDAVPVPIKDSGAGDSATKCNVLLQAYISRLSLTGFALVADMVYITQSAGRLLRALFEIALSRKWSATAIRCLELCKAVQHRAWHVQSPLRQFPTLPNEVIKRLESKDLPYERLLDLDPPSIGELLRYPKLGQIIYRALHSVPRLECQATVQPITRSTLRVEINLTPDFQYDAKLHGTGELFHIVIEDHDSTNILYHQPYFLSTSRAKSASEQTLSVTVSLYEPLPPQYFVRVLSDRWFGNDIVLPISFRHLLLPDRYAPPTELLELQPLHISELAGERYIQYMQTQHPHLQHFTAVQTQVFHSLYTQSDNVFVAAPPSGENVVLAELAIFSLIAHSAANAKPRILYIQPNATVARLQNEKWAPVMQKTLGLRTTLLTDEVPINLQLLSDSNNQLVIATPSQLDLLQRRYKQRKAVADWQLVIATDLHLVSDALVGHVYEVVCSRLRYVASLQQSSADSPAKTRFVGLSSCVANAQHIGEWIGAKQSTGTIFNFFPSARQIPLEIKLSAYYQQDARARLQSATKPIYKQLMQYSAAGQALVWTGGRRSTKQLATDLLTFYTNLSTDDNPVDNPRWLKQHTPDGLREATADVLGNAPSWLVDCLAIGVGVLYNSLLPQQQSLILRLYQQGVISVLITDYHYADTLAVQGVHTVIVVADPTYDPQTHSMVDLPIALLNQLLSYAGKLGVDSDALALLHIPIGQRDYLKKFLSQPLPSESLLATNLADHFNAEVVSKRVATMQDGIDYMTWTLLYRRLSANPNFYGLAGTTHRHFSDYLSELVETTVEELTAAKCIAQDAEGDSLTPLNLGMIAAYYQLASTTVELFARSLQRTTKLKGLLEILSVAHEFDHVTVRDDAEADMLRVLSRHLPVTLPAAADFTSPATKVEVLLQCWFSRVELSSTAANDIRALLPTALRLLAAMVDVLSSSGWLIPALGCMELSQMITQQQWNTDSALLQLPHMTKQLVDIANRKYNVRTINDLIDMEDDDRTALLTSQLREAQVADVAAFCNTYPDIELQYSISEEDEIRTGETVSMTVTVNRELDDEQLESLTAAGVPAMASRYPAKQKLEGWWVVVGRQPEAAAATAAELLSIKRLVFSKPTMTVKLEFDAPSTAGEHTLVLNFMSDSYIGVDQELQIKLQVRQGEEVEEDSDSAGEESATEEEQLNGMQD